MTLTTPHAGGTPPVGLAAPAGLRANVYSSTALGLAWTRATRAGLRYEVRRDGQVLGTSYIDLSLTGARDYRYEVFAIDRQGRRSAAAITTVRTPGVVVGKPFEPPHVSLELVTDKTFRISWQPSEGANSYRVLENPDGNSGFTRIGGELDASTLRLDHRVAQYSRINARHVVQACNDSGCVDSDQQIVSGSLDRAIGYFKASNTEGGLDETGNIASDVFGSAVSLSSDGNTPAVGAPWADSAATGSNREQNDNSARDSGAVYVLLRTGGSWQQQT